MKTLLILFMLIVALTNMIVNVIKNICEEKIQNPKRLVLIVATVLCIIAAVAAGLIYHCFSCWYMWAGAIIAAIICGFIAAHVAMFGYDEAYSRISELIEALIGYLVGGLSK